MTDPCAICNIDLETHSAFEIELKVNHKFSADGQLIALSPQDKKPAKNLVAIPDPALRLVLIEKGLITYEELMIKEVQLLGRQQVPTPPTVDG